MSDTIYKRLTAVSGLIAAVCAMYSIYLTLTTPKTFLQIADRTIVEDAASLEKAVADLESARKEIERMALDNGIKNVAVLPRLDEPKQIGINKSERFDTRDNLTTTVAINSMNPGNFYATVGGERQSFQTGDTKVIDAQQNCSVHFTSLNYDEKTVGVQVFCNEK